jgi:hypothetical protein
MCSTIITSGSCALPQLQDFAAHMELLDFPSLLHIHYICSRDYLIQLGAIISPRVQVFPILAQVLKTGMPYYIKDGLFLNSTMSTVSSHYSPSPNWFSPSRLPRVNPTLGNGRIQN